jgi:tRNA A22 N-methylase
MIDHLNKELNLQFSTIGGMGDKTLTQFNSPSKAQIDAIEHLLDQPGNRFT